jgi:hypothetical protein
MVIIITSSHPSKHPNKGHNSKHRIASLRPNNAAISKRSLLNNHADKNISIV